MVEASNEKMKSRLGADGGLVGKTGSQRKGVSGTKGRLIKTDLKEMNTTGSESHVGKVEAIVDHQEVPNE
jgi:hypothetical protein